MSFQRVNFAFLNIGHFLDHYFVLIFATVTLSLMGEWGMSYADLVPYATPSFLAFGLGALPAGWLADKWSRPGMMVVFFIGCGLSGVLAAFVDGPVGMAVCLTLLGLSAAIYHPVGLAMITHDREKTGIPLAINGLFGNLGVACAALCTALLIDQWGWRSAFLVPGLIAVGLGLAYRVLVVRHQTEQREVERSVAVSEASGPTKAYPKSELERIFAIVLLTTALGGVIFQSTTFSLPKVLSERLVAFDGSLSEIGGYSFLVICLASLAQLAVGYLLDRHSARTIFSVVAVFQVMLFALMTRADGLTALLLAIGFMLMVFGQIPINDVLVGRIATGEWKSRAFAVRYLVTFTVMASTLPLIAWIHGNWGFESLFWLLAATASIIFFTTLRLPGRHAAMTAGTGP